MPNLDLRELQQAMLANDVFHLSVHEQMRLEQGKEDPRLSFGLRDAVQKVLPGSYCAPTLIEMDDEANVPFGVLPRGYDMRCPAKVPALIYGSTETEAWAHALIALWRAGLLKEVEE